MKRIFVWLFVTLLCMQVSSVFAQDAKILEKSHKDLMKSLKKQLGLKDVSVKVEKDGFWYFLLTNKYRELGIANQSGKIIAKPSAYKIIYTPSMQEGRSINFTTDDYTWYTWHKASPATFLLSEYTTTHTLIDTEGTILCDNIEGAIDFRYGYWHIMKFDHAKHEALNGLLSADGKVILKTEYSFISLGGRVEYDGALDESPYCIFKKEIDGVTYKGGLALDGSLPQTPCSFYEIDKPDGLLYKTWRVTTKAGSFEREEYDPSKHYDTSLKDIGQQYYMVGEYDKTISYYAETGISAPWAKFFTGESFYHKAREIKFKVNDFITTIEKAQKGGNISLSDLYENLVQPSDLDLAEKSYHTAHECLKAYLAEDSLYKENATWSLNGIEDAIDGFETLKQQYNKAMMDFKIIAAEKAAQEAQLKEQQRLAEIKRQQEAQQRETEIMMGILKIFANALAGNSGSSSSSYSSGSGTYNSTTSTSGSSSKGINQSKLADWQSRKANAERLLEDYREQLRRDPDNAALKSKIRSQEGVLRTCNEQISLIESGQIR